MIPEYSPVQR